ncbi:unnamed protein product [Lota lota]
MVGVHAVLKEQRGEESSRPPSVSNMLTPHSSHINLSHSQQCKTAFRTAKRSAGYGELLTNGQRIAQAAHERRESLRKIGPQAAQMEEGGLDRSVTVTTAGSQTPDSVSLGTSSLGLCVAGRVHIAQLLCLQSPGRPVFALRESICWGCSVHWARNGTPWCDRRYPSPVMATGGVTFPEMRLVTESRRASGQPLPTATTSTC